MQYVIALFLIYAFVVFVGEVVLPFLGKVFETGLLGAAVASLGVMSAMGIHAINRKIFWAEASQSKLTRDWLTVSHNSMHLKLSLNRDRIQYRSGMGLAWLPAAVATLVAPLLAATVWNEREPGWSVFMLVSAGFFLLLALGIWPHLSSARRSLERELRTLQKNMDGHHGLTEFSEVIGENGRLASALGIHFENNHACQLVDRVAGILPQLVNDPGAFQAALSAVIVQARKNGMRLKKAGQSFEEARKIFSLAASSVNRAGQASMFVYLDELLAHMGATKEHLRHGNWSQFDSDLAEICADLKLLADNADQRPEEGFSQDDRATSSGLMDDSYAVLGVHPTASDEEIQQVFRRLVSIYHPDKNIVSSDEQFKRIKAAFDEIRKVRGLT